MGKRDKKTKKGKGAEKTAMKTNKKLEAKQKKLLQKLGEQDIAEVVAGLEAAEAARQTVTETVCAPPTPRSNFTLCAHPAGDREELILFGGEFYNGNVLTLYNDLFFYSVPKNEWRSVRSPAGPAPRCSHQMVATANDGGQLWIWGGEHPSPSQMQFHHYRDLWVFRLAERRWEKIKATGGGGPSARSGHRMVALKKRLFVFGGFYDSGTAFKYYNDVWCFSLETYTWHEIKCEGAVRPLPRSAASMAATPDGKLLVWGGYSRTAVKKDVDRGVTHSDMFQLVQEKSDPSGLTWKWSTVKPGGMRPPPLSGVGLTGTATPAGLVYTFGGVLDVDEDEENVSGNCTNDMHSFDLAKQVWRLVELREPKKSKAATSSKDDAEMADESASATTEAAAKTVSSDGVFTMVLGGGASASGTSDKLGKKSTTAAVVSTVPSARMKAALVVCKKHLYLYGGTVEDGNKQCTLADLYSLDLSKLEKWKTIVGKEANSHEWMESDDDSDSDDDDSDEDDSDEDDSDEDDSDDSDEMDTD